MQLLNRPTDSGDIPIAVRTAGVGTEIPVLLVHGMAGDHSTWRSFAANLRGLGRPVISVDLRGHGRSGRPGRYTLESFAEDLRFVLDAYGVERADVVGHSLGAHASLRLAMADPARVRSLVLEECPPMPRDQHDVDEEITVGAGVGERLRGLGWALADPRPLLRFDKAVADQVNGAFASADPQWWARLRAVTARTLVISGGVRSFLPAQHLSSLSAALCDSRFEVIEAGHSVHRDRRREFSRLAGGFLMQS